MQLCFFLLFGCLQEVPGRQNVSALIVGAVRGDGPFFSKSQLLMFWIHVGGFPLYLVLAYCLILSIARVNGSFAVAEVFVLL